MTKLSITVPITFNEIEKIVSFEVSFAYNGIGPYEFWGQKCNDKGSLEIEEVSYKTTNDFLFDCCLEELIQEFFDKYDAKDQNAMAIWDKAYEALEEREVEANRQEFEMEKRYEEPEY
jgi:hypothetical protein